MVKLLDFYEVKLLYKKLETLDKRVKYFQFWVRVLSPPGLLQGTKGIKLLLLCYSGPLKSKKSFLFHLLPVTLRKTVEKPNFAKILRFLVEKGGVSSRGIPHLDPCGVSKGTPAFDPPFSTRKMQNYRSIGFSNCFPQL